MSDGNQYVYKRQDRGFLIPGKSRRKKTYAQIFVRVHHTFLRQSSEFLAFIWIWRLFSRSCQYFCSFARISCFCQTFVRQCLDFRPFIFRFFRPHLNVVQSPDFCAFICRSSCVHVALHSQTVMPSQSNKLQ